MKIHTDFAQGSGQWLEARMGVVTASEFEEIVTPLWKVKKGKEVEKYLNKKLAEWWLQMPWGDGFKSFAMDNGSILEDEAKPKYELLTGEAITNVGFITSRDGLIGCSPDGLIGDHAGIEIKSPNPDTHVGYLMANVLPVQYGPQVQGSMFVTGRKEWRFMSYRRKFTSLILTVKADEAAQSAISEALDSFLERFEAGKARLLELNGGKRPEKPKGTDEPFTWETKQPSDIYA